MNDSDTKCWEQKGLTQYDMCCVEYARLQKLLVDRRPREGKPDFVFTRSYQIIIRGSGIGNSYFVQFDGDAQPIEITHFEHA